MVASRNRLIPPHDERGPRKFKRKAAPLVAAVCFSETLAQADSSRKGVTHVTRCDDTSTVAADLSSRGPDRQIFLSRYLPRHRFATTHRIFGSSANPWPHNHNSRLYPCTLYCTVILLPRLSCLQCTPPPPQVIRLFALRTSPQPYPPPKTHCLLSAPRLRYITPCPPARISIFHSHFLPPTSPTSPSLPALHLLFHPPNCFTLPHVVSHRQPYLPLSAPSTRPLQHAPAPPQRPVCRSRCLSHPLRLQRPIYLKFRQSKLQPSPQSSRIHAIPSPNDSPLPVCPPPACSPRYPPQAFLSRFSSHTLHSS